MMGNLSEEKRKEMEVSFETSKASRWRRKMPKNLPRSNRIPVSLQEVDVLLHSDVPFRRRERKRDLGSPETHSLDLSTRTKEDDGKESA